MRTAVADRLLTRSEPSPASELAALFKMSTNRIVLADHSFVSFKHSNTRIIGAALFALAADEVHCTRDQKTSCQVSSGTQQINVVAAVACAERSGQGGMGTVKLPTPAPAPFVVIARAY